MAWEKGKPRPKTSGRKKGTPNKKTQELLTVCEEMGFDPFRELLKKAQEGSEKCLIEACSYLYPKRKAIEHSVDPNPYMDMTLDELKEIAKERLQKK